MQQLLRQVELLVLHTPVEVIHRAGGVVGLEGEDYYNAALSRHLAAVVSYNFYYNTTATSTHPHTPCMGAQERHHVVHLLAGVVGQEPTGYIEVLAAGEASCSK